MPTPDPDAPVVLPPAIERTLAHSSLLETYWPTAIALVLAVAVVGWWAWRRRRRPHGGRRRGARLATAATWVTAPVLVALAVLLAVNTWVGYVPTFGAARTLAESLWGSEPPPAPAATAPVVVRSSPPDTPQGTGGRVTTATTGGIITETVRSTAHGVPDRPVRFYLPPGYDAPGNTTRYPVYYLLHGSPGTGGDWVGAGKLAATMDTLIDAHQIPPAIVATPDLTTGTPNGQESVNYPGTGPQFETFFQDDVVPYTDATLRTVPDRGHRVVGGMSSGGLESLTFALHRPDAFGATISIMAYAGPVGPDLRKDAATVAAYSPVRLIKAAAFTQPLAVYLAQGDQESEADNRRIEAALRARGQPVTLQIFPGEAHNWNMAYAAEPYGLVWAARQLGWT